MDNYGLLKNGLVEQITMGSQKTGPKRLVKKLMLIMG